MFKVTSTQKVNVNSYRTWNNCYQGCKMAPNH